MTRHRLSTSARMALLTRKNHICHLCGGIVQDTDAWDVSHVTPLEMGGADDETNWDVAHRKCHRTHTATVDAPMIAKAKRREARHLGARKSSRPLPGGRQSKWKKRMDGSVVLR